MADTISDGKIIQRRHSSGTSQDMNSHPRILLHLFFSHNDSSLRFDLYAQNGLLSLRCGIVAYIISTLFEDYGNFYINDYHAMHIYYKKTARRERRAV